LIELQNDNPELAEDDLIKRLALRMLNSVEMSLQEAAWYLLRQSMSHASRLVVYVPTQWPHERQKAYKKKVQMDREGIALDSTDIWTKNQIQKYEERLADLERTCLADFMAWYTPKNAKRRRAMDDDSDYDDDEYKELETNANTKYKKRDKPRVLRWRSYDISDVKNHKREMVLLYVPFRNEAVDINDRDRYLDIFNENENYILIK
jgi:hypothetical protein